MKNSITNTSQSLILNSYYGFECDEKNRINVNKKIESKFNEAYLMNILNIISKSLDTTILNTSSHVFEPSGTSVTSIIESNEIKLGLSGVAHLKESHISFHSYYENSIKNIIILRLELHVSSCSRKNVYHTLEKLSSDDLYETYDALTIDFFHRGIRLEKNHNNEILLHEYLDKKSNNFKINKTSSSSDFSSYKLLKHRDKIILKDLPCYIYSDLA
tara:strand:+ start:18521 stop:19168 length:648 start_codon:yes stop_codon:yes gene_type:complete